MWLCLFLGRRLQMHSGENSNTFNQCEFASSIWGDIWNAWWRKVGQLQPCEYSATCASECGQCEFPSSQASDLRRHLETHSGDKQNKCNPCDYASSQTDNLWIHLQTHSGEKPNANDMAKSQMERMCIFSGRQFEDTFESAQCRKPKRCSQLKSSENQPTPTKTW